MARPTTPPLPTDPRRRRLNPGWAILAAVVILAGTFGLLLIHLANRAEVQRKAICGILQSLPPGIPSLDNARKAFRCPASTPVSKPTPAPTVTATVTAKPRPRPARTVAVPGPTIFEPTPMPGPTVTVTKHPHSQPRHHKPPKPRPHPKPSPCIDGICLPGSLPLG